MIAETIECDIEAQSNSINHHDNNNRNDEKNNTNSNDAQITSKDSLAYGLKAEDIRMTVENTDVDNNVNDTNNINTDDETKSSKDDALITDNITPIENSEEGEGITTDKEKGSDYLILRTTSFNFDTLSPRSTQTTPSAKASISHNSDLNDINDTHVYDYKFETNELDISYKKYQSKCLTIIPLSSTFTMSKLFYSIICIINIALLVYAIYDNIGGVYYKNHAYTICLYNILVTVSVRNEVIHYYLYEVFARIGYYCPLFIKYYIVDGLLHIGGIHAACGTMSLMWLSYATYVNYTTLYTSYIVTNISYIACISLIITIASAIPLIRYTFHNQYEMGHRFAGWIGLILLWVIVFYSYSWHIDINTTTGNVNKHVIITIYYIYTIYYIIYAMYYIIYMLYYIYTKLYIYYILILYIYFILLLYYNR